MVPIACDVLTFIRCWLKTWYVRFLIMRHGFVGWPSLCLREGARPTREQTLDHCIGVLSTVAELDRTTMPLLPPDPLEDD